MQQQQQECWTFVSLKRCDSVGQYGSRTGSGYIADHVGLEKRIPSLSSRRGRADRSQRGRSDGQEEQRAVHSPKDCSTKAWNQQKLRWNRPPCRLEVGKEKERLYKYCGRKWKKSATRITNSRRTFSKKSDYFTSKETCVKALEHHVECMKVKGQKLRRENEQLWVSKQYIIAFLINRQRPKRTEKAIKLLMKGLEDKYVGISL